MNSLLVSGSGDGPMARLYDTGPSSPRKLPAKLIALSKADGTSWTTAPMTPNKVREYVTVKKMDRSFILPDLPTEDQRSLTNALKARRSRDHNKACMESALQCNTESLQLMRQSRKKLAAVAKNEPMFTFPTRLHMFDADSLSETSDSSKTTRSFASEINDAAKKVRAELTAYTAFVEHLFSVKLSALEKSLVSAAGKKNSQSLTDSPNDHECTTKTFNPSSNHINNSGEPDLAPQSLRCTSTNIVSVSKIFQKSVEQTVEDSRKKLEKAMESNFNRLSEQYDNLVIKILGLTDNQISSVVQSTSEDSDLESNTEPDIEFNWKQRSRFKLPVSRVLGGVRTRLGNQPFRNKPQHTVVVKSAPRQFHSEASRTKRGKLILLDDNQDSQESPSKTTSLPLTHFLSTQRGSNSDSESDLCRK